MRRERSRRRKGGEGGGGRGVMRNYDEVKFHWGREERWREREDV